MRLTGLHPELRDVAQWTIEVGRFNGIPRIEVTSVFRDPAQQRRLKANADLCAARGLAGTAASLSPGMSCRFPAAAPGRSAHQFGLAWDSVVEPKFQALWTAVRRAVGWRVPAGDAVHAELPGWQRYVGLTS